MRKSDLKHSQETPEEELKHLRKENARLKSQKEADKAKIEAMRKELKKKKIRDQCSAKNNGSAFRSS